MTDIEFSTSEEARAYCERVLAEMVRLFSIERGETMQRMNQQWGGQDMTGPDDVLLLTPELPDYWARRIYYGPHAMWWPQTSVRTIDSVRSAVDTDNHLRRQRGRGAFR